MQNLFHPVTLGIIFIIGIFLSIKYFLKTGSFFKKIGYVFIVVILILGIDSTNLIQIPSKISNILLPCSIIGLMSSIYFEDLYNYKKYHKLSQKEIKKSTLQYLFIVIVTVIFGYYLVIK